MPIVLPVLHHPQPPPAAHPLRSPVWQYLTRVSFRLTAQDRHPGPSFQRRGWELKPHHPRPPTCEDSTSGSSRATPCFFCFFLIWRHCKRFKHCDNQKKVLHFSCGFVGSFSHLCSSQGVASPFLSCSMAVKERHTHTHTTVSRLHLFVVLYILLAFQLLCVPSMFKK